MIIEYEYIPVPKSRVLEVYGYLAGAGVETTPEASDRFHRPRIQGCTADCACRAGVTRKPNGRRTF